MTPSTPARFNADPRRLRESAGCAGKLAVFAVRLDTFAADIDAVRLRRWCLPATFDVLLEVRIGAGRRWEAMFRALLAQA